MSTSPRHLGKYELQERLGQGGMAEVWKGLDPQLKRFVAIKFLHANLRSDPDFMGRFQREGQAIAALRHPNIVQVYDFQISSPDDDEPIAYMVMDYIEGPTLAAYMRSTSYVHRFPTPEEIVGLFTPINLAIDYAHRQRMVHRDIKPANILLDTRNTLHNEMGEPILTDFGIVKILGAATITSTGTSMGTPLYISPEQVQAQPGNERSDIYSLGVMLYEMCTGQPIYRGDTPYAIMAQHVHSTPTPPSYYNPLLSPDLDAVILCALAKDPQARFANASAMTVALAEAFHVPVPNLARRSISSFDLDGRRISSDALYLVLSAGETPVVAEKPGMQGDNESTLVPGETVQSNMPVPATFAVVEEKKDKVLPVVDDKVVRNKPGKPFSSGGDYPSLAQPVDPITPLPLAKMPAPLPAAPTRQPRAPIIAFAHSRQRNRLFAVGSVLMLIVLIGAVVLVLRSSGGAAMSGPTIVGTVAFSSDNQLDSQRIPFVNDKVQVQLQHISDPMAGNQYYAWLLGSNAETAPVYLGIINVKQGSATLTYNDNQQRDLLAQMSSFLVTEQTAGVTPGSPSLDRKQWRYNAAFPQKPSPIGNLNYLDHIRHLLASEPGLESLGLADGVDYWLLNNTQEMYKLAIEARDTANLREVRQMITDVIYYLDGKCALQELADTSGSKTPENYTIMNATKVSLLDCAPVVEPPGYISHVARHLSGIVNAPGASAQQVKIAAQVNSNLDMVSRWLERMRVDALLLAEMDDTHLAEAQPLRNDLVVQASYVVGGSVDPITQAQQMSVGQICNNISLLANLSVSPYK